jgi:hypothetical protein
MGIVKCSDCGVYMHDDEVVWIKIDDTHDVAYCVGCCPEQDDYDEQQ